jgi:magnesium transporter
VLTAYLYDEQQSQSVESWPEVAQDLKENQVLWLDLLGPSSDEERAVREALDLSEFDISRLEEHGLRAELNQSEAHIQLTVVAASESTDDARPETVTVECFVGRNWIVTAHNLEIPVIDDFRERAEGEGEVGTLDAPSFLAELLEWVVASYRRAFDEIESDLEALDVRVLRIGHSDPHTPIGTLVDARQRIGTLRRSLAQHREVFATLGESEFDPISSEESGAKFNELSGRVDHALDAARDTRDAVLGSFEVLNARAQQRTNEIMKVLTLASVLLLPGALIAGVMGMNFKVSIFQHASLFWVTCGVIVLIGIVTLGIARQRRWV